ncbi:cryptochrome/photolyase family protein [Mucilaginibacter pallidiroseus]|uniref:Cryptochrome/photolyase family protein n=1 Tax=Mucilaginibacter pallidiroseus TaxID=2599295 RepID=A0A563UG00_9SPHI|nr:cryptochrome/photolyase family protein [Mucilaginibacter pallidiroseus]TWR30291.1 cryptochrome/photolyase family protein [Mucilaginibacter pallidiroseus]
MDTAVTLIFPHQLFNKHPAVKPSRKVYLVEEELFFNQYNFNKQKLVLHRASMQFYADYLREKNVAVDYIEATDKLCDIRKLIPYLAKQGVDQIHYGHVADDWLDSRLNKAAAAHGIELTKYRSPNWLNDANEVSDFFDNKRTYFQTDFYIQQRKQRNLLLEADNKPLGGKWTYDSDNRKKFPKNEQVPVLDVPAADEYIKDARVWVNKHYPDNYGTTASPFGGGESFYPINFKDAETWLQQFYKQRFHHFGVYEDAMVAKESFLYHSVLTPMLNIGLLSPQQVIDGAITFAAENNIPLNSVEGFLRQVMGWREFIHIVYERESVKQRTKNYWGFKRKIPSSFWKGETGILPVDTVIKKVLATGYSHHIERLMVMGNFLLLCEFDPDEVYRWFMEMYIDAYDWVMVPNTYGMTQFADGGLMMTKPYISGSNYLLKMGDWAKGPWQQIWDGLFWRFMHVHRNFFTQNPRLGMLVNTFDKMDASKQKAHLKAAEDFLTQLDKD